MSILDSVLRCCVPVEWEDTNQLDYQNVRYRLYEVGIGGGEYASEVNAFVNGDPKVEIQNIQRVQNPFQLGRFVLRKEQKKFRGENLEVVKYYHPLRSVDLEVALEHNMDVRRYGSKQPGQYYSKNPKFYSTPGQAFYSIPNCEYIVIVNVLGRNTEVPTTYKENDTEYMPIYVARVKGEKLEGY